MNYAEPETAFIDLDGVVADIYTTIFELGGMMGYDCPPPRDWYYAEQPDEVVEWVGSLFANPDFYAGLPVIHRARPALYTLASRFRLVYITARASDPGSDNAAIKEATHTWLRHNDLPEGSIIFCPPSHKVDVLGLYNTALAVEDNPLTALAYHQAGIRTYLVDYPFNQHLPDEPGLRRIHSLIDVVAHEEIPAVYAAAPLSEELLVRRLLKEVRG